MLLTSPLSLHLGLVNGLSHSSRVDLERVLKTILATVLGPDCINRLHDLFELWPLIKTDDGVDF